MSNIGVPLYLGIHSHILGYPNIWECIPRYCVTPIYLVSDRRSAPQPSPAQPEHPKVLGNSPVLVEFPRTWGNPGSREISNPPIPKIPNTYHTRILAPITQDLSNTPNTVKYTQYSQCPQYTEHGGHYGPVGFRGSWVIMGPWFFRHHGFCPPTGGSTPMMGVYHHQGIYTPYWGYTHITGVYLP